MATTLLGALVTFAARVLLIQVTFMDLQLCSLVEVDCGPNEVLQLHDQTSSRIRLQCAPVEEVCRRAVQCEYSKKPSCFGKNEFVAGIKEPDGNASRSRESTCCDLQPQPEELYAFSCRTTILAGGGKQGPLVTAITPEGPPKPNSLVKSIINHGESVSVVICQPICKSTTTTSTQTPTTEKPRNENPPPPVTDEHRSPAGALGTSDLESSSNNGGQSTSSEAAAISEGTRSHQKGSSSQASNIGGSPNSPGTDARSGEKPTKTKVSSKEKPKSQKSSASAEKSSHRDRGSHQDSNEKPNADVEKDVNTEQQAGAQTGGPAAAGCFSAEMKVHSKHRGSVTMADLEVGEEVLATVPGFDGALQTVFSKVELFIHREAHVAARFLRFRLNGGNKLELTSEHLIPVVDCCFKSATESFTFSQLLDKFSRPAGTAQASQCVILLSADGRMALSRIEAISEVFRIGVFAPVTQRGNIIVSDVLASCYSGARLSHELQRTIYGFIRQAEDWTMRIVEIGSSLWLSTSPETASPGRGLISATSDGRVSVVLEFLQKAATVLSL